MIRTKRIGNWVLGISVCPRFGLGFNVSKNDFELIVGPVKLYIFR